MLISTAFLEEKVYKRRGANRVNSVVNLTFTNKLLVNDKITVSCLLNILIKHYTKHCKKQK